MLPCLTGSFKARQHTQPLLPPAHYTHPIERELGCNVVLDVVMPCWNTPLHKRAGSKGCSPRDCLFPIDHSELEADAAFTSAGCSHNGTCTTQRTKKVGAVTKRRCCTLPIHRVDGRLQAHSPRPCQQWVLMHVVRPGALCRQVQRGRGVHVLPAMARAMPYVALSVAQQWL
jgi:hypothetical protein